MYKVGDIIQVKRQKSTVILNGYSTAVDVSDNYTTEEEITEVFDSMDKTFKCFFIKGSNELITEKMIERN